MPALETPAFKKWKHSIKIVSNIGIQRSKLRTKKHRKAQNTVPWKRVTRMWLLRLFHMLTRPAYLPCLPMVASKSWPQDGSCNPPLPWIWCIRQEGFALFRKKLVIIFIDQLSMRTSPPILLPISLNSTTTPNSICSLVHTVSQDTPVIKPRSNTRSEHNR